MSWERRSTHLEVQRRVDPYYAWAHATGFTHFFRGQEHGWFPVLIELDGVTARQFTRGEWAPPEDWREIIRVPGMYGFPPAGLENFRYCTARVREAFFQRLATDARLRKVISRVELSLPIQYYGEKLPMLGAPPAPTGGVVTGVIDDGIAFAHERFRTADGRTRVQFFWNQDAQPPAGAVDYGREFKKSGVGSLAIDFVMAASVRAGMVDEDRVYRVTRHLDLGTSGHKPLARRSTHGTHVLDLAAGYPSRTAPDDRPIIGVQLPVYATADTSGAHFGRYALDGLYYILGRAELLAPNPPPVVVNISYGFVAGPHDGSSILEKAVDQMIGLRPVPLSVVLPVGNSHLTRCHARRTLLPGQRRALMWQVQPEDHTPSYTELWLPHANAGQPARIQVRLRPPGGAWGPWVAEGESWSWQPAGQVLSEVVYHNAIAPGRDRNMVLLALAPTATLRVNEQVAPSGAWEIEVRNVGPRATIDAWIQRDDTPFGYPRTSRQSYFRDDVYELYDSAGRPVESDNASPIKRKGTISSLATGSEPVVVAGFRRSDWLAARYSASGPPILPARGQPNPEGPDVMAVSEDSAAHPGVLAAGTRSGACVAMSGTSVAAPQIARWLVEQMAAGQFPSGPQAARNSVSQFARTGAAPGYRTEANPPPGAQPPAQARRSGAGRIEAPARTDRRIER